MKQERKFRFVGDPDKYFRGDEIDKTKSYPITHSFPGWDWTLIEAIENKPYDWEEVTEQEEEIQIHNRVIHSKTETTRIPNQDQPASSMTKFEMAVIKLVGDIASNYPRPIYSERVVYDAIELAKETFKQLDELK